jgi:ribosomal protein S18
MRKPKVPRKEREAAAVRRFVKQYGRKAQKGIEPNDRRYDRKIEKAVKRMKPEALDALLRDD